MKAHKDRRSKMMFDDHREYESNYWNQYTGLRRVKCTVKDERLRIKLYQHFISKLFRVNDVVRMSPSMKAEVGDYLAEEFMVEHIFGRWNHYGEIRLKYLVVEGDKWFPPLETVKNRRIGERLTRLYHLHNSAASHSLWRIEGPADRILHYEAGELINGEA